MAAPRERRLDVIVAWTLVGTGLVALAIRTDVSGRLWDVHYDVLFWDSVGNGRVGIGLALACYALGVAAAVCGAYAAIRRIGGWPWLLTLGVATGLLACLGSSAQPSLKDTPRVVRAGRSIVRAIQRYKAEHGDYPASLSKLTPRYLAAIPEMGLAPQRRFYYYVRSGGKDERGPWFNGVKHLIGKDPYAIAVPFVPRGTIVYRSSGDYRDIGGRPAGAGWAHTSRD